MRAEARQARREIATLQSQLVSLRAQIERTNAASAATGGKGIPGLSKWGNQLQWAGRQLQYNFTLPIAIAGFAATKFALDNEKATVRIKKVYGDSGRSAQVYGKEIEALGRNFEVLSSRFGVNQAAVLDIAASWSAAGSSGVALARATKLTLETMVLGEMDAASATQALIAIQAQYNFSTKQLSQTIDTLNMIENQTGITMQGLIDGFTRAAGVARTAGIDTQHLGAMLAALVPSAGSAANAGNALKTIISRLLSPTKEASQVMQLMHLNIKETAWQSMNGTQRLEALAGAYSKLIGPQKIVVASTIASRWQINRFDVLMKDLNNDLGYYNRALKATTSPTANFKQKVQELNYVLDSNPQRLKQIWIILQNVMANVIQPAIPIILRFGTGIANIARWFENLSPQVQATTMGVLLFLAAVGPVARYIGSVANLIGLLSEAVHFLIRNLILFGSYARMALVPVFGLIEAAIGGMQVALLGAANFMRTVFTAIMWNIGGLIQHIVIPALATVGRAMLAALMPGLIAVRVAIGQTIMQMRGAIMTSLMMMATSLRTIWGSMMVQLGALTATGLGRIAALWLVFSSRVAATAILMATNIPRLFAAMYIGILAGARRLVMVIPLMLAGMGTAFRTGLIAMAAGVGRFSALLVGGFARLVPMLAGALISPWGIAIAAVLGILYTFRDRVGTIFKDIINAVRKVGSGIATVFSPVVDFFDRAVQGINDAFWKLPASVTGAFISVVRIVKTAALKVYDLFSYLNPFAHHSPSLVESVTKGMSHIKDQHASVGDAGAPFAKAASDLSSYKATAASLPDVKAADQSAQIAKGLPSLLPKFNELTKDLKALNAVLAAQKAAVDAQQAVVDQWSAALDKANTALDAQQAKLDSLQTTLDALNASYDAHKSVLNDYASAPIKGMQAMSDALFANDMAQKQLQLDMLNWQQVNGSIDTVRSNLANLQGSIEGLNAKASDLRSAGAGSDVLGPINAQIAQMTAEQGAMQKAVDASPMAAWQQQLADLQTQADKMNLQNSLQFDPMTRSIQKLADTQKELSYGEIVKGIKDEQAAMANLSPQIDAATAAVAQQKAAVDSAKAARDAISKQYDIEKAKLDALNKSYSDTEQLIRDIESALSDMGSAAQDNISKAEKAASDAAAAKSKFNTPGAQNFMNAAGATDFPNVGGASKIGREGGLGDQSAQIDQMTKDLSKELDSAFGKFDMFGPIKDMWNKGWKWMEDNVGSKIQPILNKVQSWLGGLGNFNPFKNLTVSKNVKQVFDTVLKMGSDAWNGLKNIWNLFAPDFKKIWDELVAGGKRIWNEIGPELEKFKKPLGDLGKAFSNLWEIVKPIVVAIGVVFLGALKVISSVIANTIGPVINTVIDIIKGLVKIIRGVVEVVVGILSGDWSTAWQGVVDIVSGAWDIIWGIISGVGQTLWGLVKGIVGGIVDWFVWLYNTLVGHSIIPDMIKAIVDWFKSLPGKVWDALKALGSNIKSRATEAWTAFTGESSRLWNGFIGWVRGLPTSVYNGIIAIKDKLVSAATTAWNWFTSTSSAKWGQFIGWAAGLPMNLYNKVITIKDKLVSAAQQGFQALVDRAKAIIDGKSGLIDWVKGIPGKIGSAMSAVGSVVMNAIKASWNAAAGWLNKNGLANINKVTERFGLHINSLPTFAGGGIIPGKVSKRDNVIIAARSGEGVIVPELVQAMGGARGLKAANDAARMGRINSLGELGLQGFANGGIIGTITDWIEKGAGFALDKVIAPFSAGIRAIIPGRPAVEDILAGSMDQFRAAARSWGDHKEAGGNKQLPGQGWKFQEDVLRAAFPGIVFTSAYRPGAITDSGNVSYHALGRAVDMTPDMKYFNWILENYGKTSKEIIYSPAGGRQIKDGAPFMYTGATRDMHFNHVHWAYDKGGMLPPGFTMAQNNTGRGELVLTDADVNRIFNVMTAMDSMMAKSGNGPTPGAATVARMSSAVTSLEARLRSQAPTSTDTVRGGDTIGTQLNFYGDLEFPNITNADDAEAFIRHLKGLGG